jgi:hypothetical protein
MMGCHTGRKVCDSTLSGDGGRCFGNSKGMNVTSHLAIFLAFTLDRPCLFFFVPNYVVLSSYFTFISLLSMGMDGCFTNWSYMLKDIYGENYA